MQRGNLIYLSLAGLLFLLVTLTALIPNPRDEFEYYYNEKGSLIYYRPSDISRTWVIKTSKSRFEIYTASDTSEVKNAAVNGITWSTALDVERLIGLHQVDSDLVTKNIVEIFNPTVFSNMRAVIMDNGKGGSDSVNNKEYGGLLHADGQIFQIDSGLYVPLCKSGKRAVILQSKGFAEFHDHPSGCRGALELYACTDTTLAKQPGGCGYTQGPSKIDQQAVGKRTGYVFAMRARIIFIYDNNGVKATIPFDFFERNMHR